MNSNFDEYSKIASRIVDDLPEALDQLDGWIAHAEDTNPTGSAGLASQLESAEALRDGLANVVNSAESGPIARSAEAEPMVDSAEVTPVVRSAEVTPVVRSAEVALDSGGLIESMEGVSESMRTLAGSIAAIASAEEMGHVEAVKNIADLADRFVESAEKS